MFRKHRTNRVPYRYTHVTLLLGLFGVIFIIAITLLTPAKIADASTNSTINFQARLLTNSGAVVPDGSYNVEFKIYNALSSSGSSQGSCTGDTDCLWTETRTGGNTVSVLGGYMSVQLGSVTAFPTTINWDQPLWLSIRIGGIGTPSWDPEMSPRLPLTGVPYSFRSGALAESSGSYEGTLAFGSISNNDAITLPDASGIVCLDSASACGFVIGSGTAFLQGGNSFSAAAVLGTNDSNNLQLETGGTTRLTISNSSSNLTFNASPTISVNNATSASALIIEGQTATGSSNNGGNIDLEGGAPGSGGNYGNINLSDLANFNVVQNGGSSLDVLSANTGTGRVAIDSTLNSLSPPSGLTVSTYGSATGDALGTATYYYKVTAIDSAGGETTPSAEVSHNFASGSTNYVTLTWTAVAGASGYKVYRGTAANGENVYYSTLGSVSGGVVTFTDTGATTNGSGAPPTANTASLASNLNPNPTEVTEWQTSTGSNISGLADSPVNIGDVLVLTTEITSSSDSVVSITSGGVTNWHLVEASPIQSGTKRVEMWMGTVTTIGSGTINVYYGSSPATNEITATEFTASGVNSNTNWTADTYNLAYSTATTTITYPALTTQGNSELYVGYGQTAGTGSAGSSTGFSYIVTANNNVIAYNTNLSSNTAYTPTATNTNAAYNSVAAILSATTNTNSSLQLVVGGNGTPTGQLYVSGSVPAGPIGTVSTGSSSGSVSVYVSGHYAYTANYGNNTLGIFDVSNPANPVSVGSVSTGSSSYPYSVYVSGHYAYTANDGNSTLGIFDVSNPASPVKVGSVSTGSSSTPESVYVSGRYAYTANYGNNTLGIFDISNPANPVSVGSVSTGSSSEPESVYVSGRYAYTANKNNNTLGIFDVSNPANPVQVGSVSTGSSSTPESVYVSGRYAYTANNSNSTLGIFDVSNPANPVSVGSVSTGNGSGPNSVYVSGRYAYTANNSNSTLGIFDVSNPANPVSVGSVSTGSSSYPYSVYVSGRYAYIANYGSSFLYVFDLGGAYIQQLQAGSTETGTLQVDNNAQIAGDANIQGGITIGANALVDGNIGSNGLNITGLAIPGAPSITFGGTSGSTTYGYAVSAFNTGNSSPPSTPALITTGSATLSTTNYNNVVLSTVSGAIGYNVYRTFGGGSTGLIDTLNISTAAAVTPTVFSMGGTIATITFSSPMPAYVVGQTVTLAGFSSSSINGTYAITSVTPSSNQIQVTIAGGPYTETAMGTVTGNMAIWDTGLTASGSVPTVINTTTNVFNIQNASNSTVLSANTGTGRVAIDSTLNSLSPPSGLTVSTYGSATGDALGTATYYYKVTAIDSAGGETTPSAEVSHNFASGSTNYVTLTWTAVAGASGYKVYRGTAANGENVYYSTLGSVSGGVVTFTDTGATTNGSGAPPTANTASLASNLNPNPTEVTEWQTSTGSNISGLADSPVNIGDVLVMTTEITASSDNVATVSGGGVTNWNLVEASPIQSGTKRVEMWIGTVTSIGSGTISLTFTNGIPGVNEITATEFTASGVNSNTNWTADTYNLAYSTATTTITYPALTTQGNSELYVGYGQTAGTGSAGSSTGFSYIVTANHNVIPYDTSLSSATAYTPTATNTNAAYNSVAAILSATTNTNSSLQLVVGGNGTPTGQLYVSGTVPAGPIGTVSAGSGTDPNSVYVSGRYAYTANYSNNTLSIFDVSNPANPVQVGSVSTNIGGGSHPITVYVSGHYAYVTDYTNSTLGIYDVSNPANPVAVGSITVGGTGPNDVYVSGRYAYTANYGNSSLGIYDVSNPANPVAVGSITVSGAGISEVYVSGRYAYTANYTNGTLGIFDVSNPANPVSVSSVSTGSSSSVPDGVYVSGNYAYTANFGNNTLSIFDVSNPANPVQVSSVSTGSGSPNNVYVSGRYAYVVNYGSNTLDIFDVSNPTNPVAMGSVITGTNPNSVYVSGRYAYTADSDNTLDVFDLGGAYIQQLQAGSTETGTLQVDTNAQITGDTNIQGGISIGTNAQVAGNLAVAGAANFGSILTITGGPTAAPGTPTVTSTPSGNSTNYSYEVAAINGSGQTTIASGAGATTTGAATLTATAYNTITWSAVTGAYGYNIYRTASSGAPSSLGMIGTTVGLSFNDTGIVANTSATAPASNSITTAFQVQSASGTTYLSVDATNGADYLTPAVMTTTNNQAGVIVGNGYSSGATTLIGLTLSSDSNFTETTSVCTSSVNDGALYYNSNSTSVSMRACVDGSWRDVLTNDDLGLMLYGVVPDSGANPGDLASLVTAKTTGPCKVSWLTSTSVSVSACTLYTSGRKIVQAATTVTTLSGASKWYHLCYTGSSDTLAASTGGTETADMPAWSATAPIVCLADVETGGSDTITNIYDTRVFTTSTKTFAVDDTATGLGWIVKQSTTPGIIAPTSSATDGPILGVVALYSGTVSTTTPNVILVTNGPVFVKVTSGTASDTIEPTTTSGYGVASTTTPSATSFGNLGAAQLTSDSSCSASTNCQYSELTDVAPR